MNQPRRVVLFSGHMIDRPERAEPRFPPDKESVAARAIVETLTQLALGESDLAISSGACGGDLLFVEACLARRTRLQLHLPFDEATFLRESVEFADARWRERYLAARSDPLTRVRLAPELLGSLPEGEDPYERNNVWMLDSALGYGSEKVDFVCLWNGQGGDGPGGTQHMMQEVREHSGRVHWLDTRSLWSSSGSRS